jgi:hypothetical protein
MFDRFSRLVSILERMEGLYGRMLDILSREKSALIAMDFETVLVEAREKDEIVSAIRGLDRDRLQMQDQFSVLMGMDPETVTLRSMAEDLIEQGGSSREIGVLLMERRESLGRVVDSIREQVNRNTVFIERSIRNLQGIASTVTSALAGRTVPNHKKTSLYNKSAKVHTASAPSGTLVEKR